MTLVTVSTVWNSSWYRNFMCCCSWRSWLWVSFSGMTSVWPLMEAARLVGASFSIVTLAVSALTMVVSPRLGAEAMTDERNGELGEVVSSAWRPLGKTTRGWTKVSAGSELCAEDTAGVEGVAEDVSEVIAVSV